MRLLLLLPLIVATRLEDKCVLQVVCQDECHKFEHKILNNKGDLTQYEYTCKKGHLWIKNRGWHSSNYITAAVCNTTTGYWYEADSRTGLKQFNSNTRIMCDRVPAIWIILPIIFILIILIFVILLAIVLIIPLRRRYLRRQASQTKSQTKSTAKTPVHFATTAVDAAPTPLAAATPADAATPAAGAAAAATATPLTPATPVSPFEVPATPTPTQATPTPVQATPVLTTKSKLETAKSKTKTASSKE